MNKIDFKQTGGFPLDSNILDFLQKSYQTMQVLGELAGNYSILQGCTQSGSTVSDGVVYIDGEVLPFKSASGSMVVIREEKRSLIFEDGSNKEVQITRYATFGVSSLEWTKFKRVDNLQKLMRAVVPSGMISMWSGSVATIPNGWVLCNGQNGTPDLQNRFIVGAGDEYGIDETGGEKTHMLTAEEMPSHFHHISLSGSHQHDFRDAYYVESYNDRKAVDGTEYAGESLEGSGSSDRNNNYLYYKNRRTNSAWVSLEGDTNSVGEGKAHENRPPYYALAYIMFIG